MPENARDTVGVSVHYLDVDGRMEREIVSNFPHCCSMKGKFQHDLCYSTLAVFPFPLYMLPLRFGGLQLLYRPLVLLLSTLEKNGLIRPVKYREM